MSANAANVFRLVIEDVIRNVRPQFLAAGLDESAVKELQELWEQKLREAAAADSAAASAALAAAPPPAGALLTATPLYVPGMGGSVQSTSSSALYVQQQQQQQHQHQHQHQQYLLQQQYLQQQHRGVVLVAPANNSSGTGSSSSSSSSSAAAYAQIPGYSNPAHLSEDYPTTGSSAAYSSVVPIVAPPVTYAPPLGMPAFTRKPQARSAASIPQTDGFDDDDDDDDDDDEFGERTGTGNNGGADDDNADGNDNGDGDSQQTAVASTPAAASASAASETPGEPEDNLDDSELDISDDVEPDTKHLVLCQFEKVSRVKNKRKCNLKDGVMKLNGKDYLFRTATGEFEW